MQKTEFRYTVWLCVDVLGPDAEWDEVAEMLANRVNGLSLKRGADFRVSSAQVDKSGEVVEE